ncbi:MAG: TolC family outer membrane protein [bacterium]|nr:TolC family outer membrane protein [bacterium]
MLNFKCQKLLGVFVFAGFLGFAPNSANAESLNSVLSSTYLGNPDINAERAKLRALDEENPRARAGYRPKVNFNADITSQRVKTRPSLSTDGRRRHGGYTVSLVQPIFRGLRTINAIRKADASIYAAREDLRLVEQNIFLDAVTAYVDVIRDRAILRLRRNNVSVIAEQQKATDDRFTVGEVTKTDVAQANARYSGAVSDLNLAQANLKTRRAIFEQVIGRTPNGLRNPKGVIKYLPRSLSGSLKRGMNEHPAILGATYLEVSATHNIHLIRGELLPEINLEGSWTRRYNPADGVERQRTGIVKGTFTMPFYAGGEISSRVRQAKQTVLRRRRELQAAKRKVRAYVVSSWGQVSSIIAQLEADRSQVKATKTALDGVQEEEKVGQRTVLDVLDAQQEYLDAQVALAITQRDLVVGRYQLLAATGRLSAAELGLRVQRYEASAHYERVERKWYGTRVEEYNDELENRAIVNDRYFPSSYK